MITDLAGWIPDDPSGGKWFSTGLFAIHSLPVRHRHRPESVILGRMNDCVDLPGPDFRPLGVISRQQAMSRGMHSRSIAHRIRSDGPWQRVLPGIYVMTTGVLTDEQRLAGALLYAGPESCLAGPTALWLHGIRGTPPDQRVHVLLPHSRQRTNSEYVSVRRTNQLPVRRVVRGWPTCDLPRAVADTSVSLHRLADVRALVSQAVQERRATVAQLTAALERAPRRGSALLRRALEEVVSGTRSAPEAEFQVLIRGTSLPEPQWNVDLFLAADGRFLACPDAWWPEVGLAHEIDSRMYHAKEPDWARTLARHNAMTAAGVTVLHTPPSRLHTDPAAVVAEVVATYRRCAGRPLPPVRSQPRAPAS